MVDVFISYSRTNEGVVARLAEAVKAEGYSVWWDAELPPHLSYGDVITEKIGQAKAAIVVWSRAAAASEWVRAEADVARNQKKLIQVSVDDAMPPLPFNQIQFAPIGDWQGEPDHFGWRKVKASLTALCGARGEGAATPVPPPLRPAAPPPPPAPSPLPPPAAPARSNLLVPALLGLLVLLVGAAVYLLLVRDGGGGTGGKEKMVTPEPGPQPGGAPAAAGLRFTHPAVIDDPDGYTNVRSSASTQAAILARVEDGEVFTTFPQQGDWWQVRTADGTIGYMAASRIRLSQAARPAAAAPAPTPRSAAADPPQIIPDSSSRRLSEGDLAGLGADQLRIARNEIFARNGRIFQDPALRRHFERFSWYVPRAAEVSLSPTEQANVRLIEEAERKR